MRLKRLGDGRVVLHAKHVVSQIYVRRQSYLYNSGLHVMAGLLVLCMTVRLCSDASKTV